MKKNILTFGAIALVGFGLFALTDLRAQDQTTAPAAPAAPAAPPARQLPPPGGRSMPPHGRAIGLYHQSIRMLTMVKSELERSKDDYNGHRQSALDACTKALAELQAVQEAALAEMPKPNQNPPNGGAQPAPSPNPSSIPPASAPSN